MTERGLIKKLIWFREGPRHEKNKQSKRYGFIFFRFWVISWAKSQKKQTKDANSHKQKKLTYGAEIVGYFIVRNSILLMYNLQIKVNKHHEVKIHHFFSSLKRKILSAHNKINTYYSESNNTAFNFSWCTFSLYKMALQHFLELVFGNLSIFLIASVIEWVKKVEKETSLVWR